MSARSSNYSQSTRFLDDASDEYTREGGAVRENVDDWLRFAQVYATLALVDETRALVDEQHKANVIAETRP